MKTARQHQGSSVGSLPQRQRSRGSIPRSWCGKCRFDSGGGLKHRGCDVEAVKQDYDFAVERMEGRLLSLSEAAAIMTYDEGYVKGLRNKGLLHAEVYGKRLFFWRDGISRYMKTKHGKSGRDPEKTWDITEKMRRSRKIGQ